MTRPRTRPAHPTLTALSLAATTLLAACGAADADPATPDAALPSGQDARDMRVGPTPDATPGPGTLPATDPDASTGPGPEPTLDSTPEPTFDALIDAGPRPDPDAAAPPPPAPDAGPEPPPLVECNALNGLRDQALVEVLHDDLHADYRPVAPEPDQGGTPNRYTTARHLMFIDAERIENGPDGEGGVECLYTATFFPLAPGQEPLHDVVNAEHVRPRSELNPDRDSVLFSHQESDIHHLYPSLPGANSTRGSLPFGDPVRITDAQWAPSLLGEDEHGQRVFAPRPERKGDVARVIFYMTARWGLDLQDWEEEALKRWDVEDPVSERERTRNDIVEALQGNRNPFVDCPGLAQRVEDFTAFDALDTNENLPSP
ncbi:endonuclease [Myxococcota bacterium]|nr:endonuclease [Myxococcota bacterium]